MASTSTSKQPMLVDRPFHEFVTVGGTTALTVSSDFTSIASGGCVKLLDCTSNDGGVIDSISIVANQSGTTAAIVLVFLSTATAQQTITAANTACVASAVIASSTAGERTNISLPPLLVPVPNLGGTTSVSELQKKNSGLYVPVGKLIYVGVSAAISAPSSATRVHVFAQGGFY